MQKSFKTTGTLKMGYTPETNIEPANHPFEKENHLPNFHFGVPCWFSGVHWKQKSPNLEIINFVRFDILQFVKVEEGETRGKSQVKQGA